MSTIGTFNNHVSHHGHSVQFGVTIEVRAKNGDHIGSGVGSSDQGLALASEAAYAGASAGVKSHAAAFEREAKRRKAESQVDWQKCFTAEMFSKLGHPCITYIPWDGSGDGLKLLQEFVDVQVTAATASKDRVVWYGVDSEGHNKGPAKYIQVSASQATVVVFMSGAAIEILARLLRMPNVRMVVIDAAIEKTKLKPLLDCLPGLNGDRMFDLQILAKSCMPGYTDTGTDKPSQEKLTSYLLELPEPGLTKMANLHEDLNMYEPFERPDLLPLQLQVYAAVDAMANLWAFHKFRATASEDLRFKSGLTAFEEAVQLTGQASSSSSNPS